MRTSWLAVFALVGCGAAAPTPDRDADARAAFEHAQQATHESFALEVGSPDDLDAYVATVTASIGRSADRARIAVDRYADVIALHRPAWTIAALVEQARIYEALVRAVHDVPIPASIVPAGVSAAGREELVASVRRVLAEHAAPIECFAIARYTLAIRAARAGGLRLDSVETATEHLRAYGDDRIRECVAAEAERDASFAPYEPGELDAPQ